MWPRKKIGEETAERRHRESLEVAREHLRLAKLDAHTAGFSRRVQVFSAAVAALGVGISLLVWRPWAEPTIPPHAVIHLFPGAGNALVPKPISQIPSPPPYPSNQPGERCGIWWRGWFDSQGAAAAVLPPTIEISAPTSADVTVTGATIRIFRSYVPKALSYIECITGAGPVPGTLLDVDLAHPAALPTIVANDGSDVPLAVPNAVINIDPGHTEYVAVTPRGAHKMYEWSVTLYLVVAQRAQTIVFGSSQHPLRTWLGTQSAIISRGYEYDLVTHSWKHVA